MTNKFKKKQVVKIEKNKIMRNITLTILWSSSRQKLVFNYI